MKWNTNLEKTENKIILNVLYIKEYAKVNHVHTIYDKDLGLLKFLNVQQLTGTQRGKNYSVKKSNIQVFLTKDLLNVSIALNTTYHSYKYLLCALHFL